MKCERNELGECKEDCEYQLLKLENPNKYMCLELPQGLYDKDIILVDIIEFYNIMKNIKPHKIKHQQEDGTYK